MAFVKLATASDVPPGKMKAFDISGKSILLANEDGSFYALRNKCPHIGKPLDKGTFDGHTITCAYHHAQFDVQNGVNLKAAKLLFLTVACADVQSFPVKIEGNDVLIELD